MPTFSASEAREQLPELMNRVAYGKERIILTRRDKKIAAIIPIEDLKALEAAEDLIDIEQSQDLLLRLKEEEDFIPWEEVKKSLKKPLPKRRPLHRKSKSRK
jgi:prevent-host-death family protein